MAKSVYFLSVMVCFWAPALTLASEFDNCSIREKAILQDTEAEAKTRLGLVLDDIEVVLQNGGENPLTRSDLRMARDVVECLSEKMGNLDFHCGVTRVPCGTPLCQERCRT